MGVGIPGTGMIGLPIAIALGALIGKSEYQLEVIKDLTEDSLEAGKKYVEENHIDIKLKTGISEKLYIEIICEAEGKTAKAIISHTHTNFIYEESENKILLDKQGGENSDSVNNNKDIILNLKLVWDFATTAPVEEIKFILEAKRYNMRAAKEALKGNYGHCLSLIHI